MRNKVTLMGPLCTTLIADYLLVIQSTSPMLLPQEPAHIKIPPSLLGDPRISSLWPYFSCLPHLLNFSDRAGKEQRKDTKLERVQQVLPRC